MISTTKALDTLQNAGFIQHWFWNTVDRDMLTESHPTVTKVGEPRFSISNETYGKESYLYFYCKDEATANEVASVLRSYGGKPDFSWCPDTRRYFQLRVSYFKGLHWWE